MLRTLFLLLVLLILPLHAAHAQITDEALRTMIGNLGFTYTQKAYASGSKFYSLTVPHSGVDTFVDISGGDTEWIWVVAELRTYPDQTKIPREALLGMLNENFQGRQMFFGYAANTGELRLKGALRSKNLDPVSLRFIIQEAAERTYNMMKLWKEELWAPAAKP